MASEAVEANEIGGLMTIASGGISRCPGTVRGHCTPLSQGGSSIRYNIVAAGDFEGMRAWREWSDVREGMLDPQISTPRLVSATRSAISHRTAINPTTMRLRDLPRIPRRHR